MARQTPSFSLDELTPAKRGTQRGQPVREDDPIRGQTIRLPDSLWRKFRALALAKNTTSIGEIRAAMEDHFAREWPKVRERLDNLGAT
jgi:hypothetical protein